MVISQGHTFDKILNSILHQSSHFLECLLLPYFCSELFSVHSVHSVHSVMHSVHSVHQSWEGPHVISSLLRTSSSSQNIIPLSTLSPTCGIIILLCIVLFVVLSRHFRSVSLLPSDSLPDISLPLQSVCKSSEHLWAKLLKLLLNVYCHCCFHWHCLVCVSKICVTNFESVTMCSMELLMMGDSTS